MTENSGNKTDFLGWKTRLSPSLGASAKLCTPCQSLFDNWESWLQKPTRSFPHHQHPAELRSAALNHCPLCYQFLKSGPRMHQIDHDITGVSMIGTHELTGIYVQSYPNHNPETNTTVNYFRLSLHCRIPNLRGLSIKPNLPPAPLSATGQSHLPALPRSDPFVFGEYSVALYLKRRQCKCKRFFIF